MSRILIVEDNPRNLKLVRDVLQVKGYVTLEAGTGEEGVRIATEERPDLILMDIQLPGMNGIEALHALRGDPATAAIPVIAVTASVMQDDRKTIMAAGFDAYVGKPINLREFLDSVRAALGAGRLTGIPTRSRRRGTRMQTLEVVAYGAAFVAGCLVCVSFFMKTIIPLRVVAIGSNVGFIAFGDHHQDVANPGPARRAAADQRLPARPNVPPDTPRRSRRGQRWRPDRRLAATLHDDAQARGWYDAVS